MNKQFYIFELNGPYNWCLAEFTTGPYYDSHDMFNGNYYSKEEAEHAIEKAIDVGARGPYFIIEGYNN